MKHLTEGLRVTHLPWPETLVLQSKDKVDVDPSDGMFLKLQAMICPTTDVIDLQREMAL